MCTQMCLSTEGMSVYQLFDYILPMKQKGTISPLPYVRTACLTPMLIVTLALAQLYTQGARKIERFKGWTLKRKY